MGKLMPEGSSAEAALPEALLRTEAYPYPVRRPRLITTHISWILVAGRFAYKLKRPVDLGFVDYSTRDRREHYCQEEVLLNRRLTRDVYLDVVPIVQTPDGIRVGGDGAVIDHAVRMRRLPQQRRDVGLHVVGGGQQERHDDDVLDSLRHQAFECGCDVRRAESQMCQDGDQPGSLRPNLCDQRFEHRLRVRLPAAVRDCQQRRDAHDNARKVTVLPVRSRGGIGSAPKRFV